MHSAVVTFGNQIFDISAEPLGQGGQGVVYGAVCTSDRSLYGVIKSFPFSPASEQRLNYLMAQGMGLNNPGVSAPLTSRLGDDGNLQCLAPFVDGVSLEQDKARSLPELLEVAILLVGTWCRLELAGTWHGDIAPSNVFVSADGLPTLIDLDNYGTVDASVPPATMCGQHSMLAPELRKGSMGVGSIMPPTLESDRFAWAVLLSYLLLGRHPADGLASSPQDLAIVMAQNAWPERQRGALDGETPIAALGTDFGRLFDEGFSDRPCLRPTAEEWYKALWRARDQLYVHDCGGALVLEDQTKECPWCRARLGASSKTKLVIKMTLLRTGEHVSVVLCEGEAVTIGRDTLAGLSKFVSQVHVEFRVSKGRLIVRHLGLNGSWLWLADDLDWRVLEQNVIWVEGASGVGFQLCLADEVVGVEALSSALRAGL